MPISFDFLSVGQSYERPFLANLWGYQSHYAISKGVVTPSNTNYIIFFVTKEKQQALPQYNDYLDGNLLFWEGEEKHGSDERVINAKNNHDEIHLFFRDTHHSPFLYLGTIELLEYQVRDQKPSEFIFQAASLSANLDIFREVREHAGEYETLIETEQEAILKSRLGQGRFRDNIIRLWGSCSVTGLENISLLRASHIKPWKDSNNAERLNPFNGLLLIPNYDMLFDKGLISFTGNGQVVISYRLDLPERREFHVDENLKLRKLFSENRGFLDYHRDEVFR